MKNKKTVENGYAPHSEFLLDEAGIFPKSDVINMWKDIPKEGTYIMGSDPYEQEGQPINLYNKIKKVLGLKFKEKNNNSKGVFYRYVDGVPQLVR